MAGCGWSFLDWAGAVSASAAGPMSFEGGAVSGGIDGGASGAEANGLESGCAGAVAAGFLPKTPANTAARSAGVDGGVLRMGGGPGAAAGAGTTSVAAAETGGHNAE